MRVLEVVELSGPDGVQIGERQEPARVGLVVEVRAVSLNYPDLLRSRGEYQEHSQPPYVLGQEFAGVVVSAPKGSGFETGDRVAGMTTGEGAAAAMLAIDPAHVVALPDNLTFEEGAAALFNYESVVVALLFRGRLQSGETVLVHGAGGGTGTAAVQIAKAAGARVIGVVSTEEKGDTARSAGADDILFATDAWKDQAQALMEGRGVDVVFDPVGGDRMLDTLRALAFGGRWIIFGFVGGGVPQVPANRILFKNIDVVGSYYGGYLAQGPKAVRRLREQVQSMLRDGKIRPIIGTVFPIEHGNQALEVLHEREAHGKVVIRIS